MDLIASFGKGQGYSKSDLVESGHPIILYGRLYTNYETRITRVDTFVQVKNPSIFSKGIEVIIPASGETAEDITVASFVDNKGILLGGDLNIVYPSKELEPMFLALSITYGSTHYSMAKMAQGKSVVHLHNSDLKTAKISFPQLNEQRKFSRLFDEIDTLIALHQREGKYRPFKEYL